jgi:hypothetical protein
VYPITDAERRTGTYSNRFAALCEQRGWKYRLMGDWDSHNISTLDLPQFGLQAQYAVDFPRDERALSGTPSTVDPHRCIAIPRCWSHPAGTPFREYWNQALFWRADRDGG